MKKVSTVLASLPLITTACGGGDSDPQTYPSASADLSQLKGIWSDTETNTFTSPSGKQTTTQAPTALINSQGKMIILTGNSELYVIEENATQAHFFSSFAYSTPVTPVVGKNGSNLLMQYYNPKRDAKGQIIIPPDGHYDAPIDLGDFNATTWNDSYATGSSWVFNITDSVGTFTASRDGGCSAEGSLSNIDSSKNELAVTITIISGCSPLTGTLTGLAWPDEGITDVLNVAVYNGFELSSKAIGWKLTKQ